MAINEDIYGDSTDWDDYFHENAKVTDYSLWSKVVAEDWNLNELIDNSVCYFAAVGNFYIGNAIAFFKTDNEICPLYEETGLHNIVFILNKRNSNGWTYNGSYVAIDWYSRWAEWEDYYTMGEYDFEYYAQTMFNFKLNKLLFIPYVRVTTQQDLDEAAATYLLGDWLENHTTDHPYLVQAYCVPYYNSSNTDTPNWQPAMENNDHFFWTQKNAYFTEEFTNHGNYHNTTATYSLGGDPDERNHIVIMGLATGAEKQKISDVSGSRYAPIGFDPDSSHYTYDNNKDYVRYFREYSEELVDEIYTQIAFYGFFFLGEGDGDFTSVTLTDPRVYLGVIDGGFTFGDYVHGEENAEQPQYSWEDTSESEYDPTKPIPKTDPWSNNFPDKIGSSNRILLNHWYWFPETLTKNVMKAINDVDIENLDKNTTYGLNPIDGVLQLRRVFFDTSVMDSIISSSHVSSIAIGELSVSLPEEGGITNYGNEIERNIIYDFPCGSIDVIEPKTPYLMNDFRAYTPFSSAVFYDAFCGVTEIDPSKILNKSLRVIQTVDFLYGDKITTLWSKDFGASDNEYIRIATLQGNCAEELPINGQAVADYQRNKYMMSNQMLVSGIGAFGRAAMGFAGATISSTKGNEAGAIAQGVGTLLNAVGDIVSIAGQHHVYDHLIPSAVKISNGSANVESGLIYPPMIIMFNPKMNEHYKQSEYAEITGFSGYKIDTLEHCGVGTHVVSHPRLNIPCTTAEMYLIQDQLQKGIYVKEEVTP